MRSVALGSKHAGLTLRDQEGGEVINSESICTLREMAVCELPCDTFRIAGKSRENGIVPIVYMRAIIQLKKALAAPCNKAMESRDWSYRRIEISVIARRFVLATRAQPQV